MCVTAVEGDWSHLIPDKPSSPNSNCSPSIRVASLRTTVFINACLPFPFQLLNPSYIYDGESCCLFSSWRDHRLAGWLSEHQGTVPGYFVVLWFPLVCRTTRER